VTDEEKKQAAINLVALRGSWTTVPPTNLPAELNELWLHHLEILRGVMAELYSERLSDQQLQALLDFYGSEMGKTILQAEAEIASRFQQRLRDLAPRLNEEASKRSSSSLGSSWSTPFGPR